MKTLVNLLITCSLCLLFTTSWAAERVTYYHNDLLGSPVAATDKDGNVVWREEYKPYGDRHLKQAASSDNKQWYTGKTHDESMGLSYFGARWYNPEIGRFTGIDPVGVDENNPHSFNRYAYANNNPYKYVDPDGRHPLLLNALIKAGKFFDKQVITKLAKFSKKDTNKGAKGGTYKLRDADGTVKRTGRSNNLERRRGEHKRDSKTKDLEFEIDRKTDCCNAQRGREQIIYDKNPGAQATNGGLNKRRPVSPKNPKRDIYRKAGKRL